MKKGRGLLQGSGTINIAALLKRIKRVKNKGVGPDVVWNRVGWGHKF